MGCLHAIATLITLYIKRPKQLKDGQNIHVQSHLTPGELKVTCQCSGFKFTYCMYETQKNVLKLKPRDEPRPLEWA